MGSNCFVTLSRPRLDHPRLISTAKGRMSCTPRALACMYRSIRLQPAQIVAGEACHRQKRPESIYAPRRRAVIQRSEVETQEAKSAGTNPTGSCNRLAFGCHQILPGFTY